MEIIEIDGPDDISVGEDSVVVILTPQEADEIAHTLAFHTVERAVRELSYWETVEKLRDLLLNTQEGKY